MTPRSGAKIQVAAGAVILAAGLAFGGWGLLEMADSYDVEMFYLFSWIVCPSLLPITVGAIVLAIGLSKLKRLRIEPDRR